MCIVYELQTNTKQKHMQTQIKQPSLLRTSFTIAVIYTTGLVIARVCGLAVPWWVAVGPLLAWVAIVAAITAAGCSAIIIGTICAVTMAWLETRKIHEEDE